MMPRKKENGSGSNSSEKPLSLHIGFPRASPSQYGSGVGNWGDPHGSGRPVSGQAPSKTVQDQRFHQLQDMFNGQIDADVVYVILSECDWKVEDAVEKLLQLTLPPAKNSLPTLKSVASTISTPSTMASERGQHELNNDMGLVNLRSRLPAVQNTDSSSSGLPMLSPRTPHVTALDFPAFPNSQEVDQSDNSIHVALDALDSYVNPDLSAYMGAFQTQTSYDINLFNVDATNSHNDTFGVYSLPSTTQAATVFSKGPSDGGMENFASMSQFGGSTNAGGSDQAPYANMGGLDMYSQTFQPIQTVCPPVNSSTTYTTSSSTVIEPVSPRTAFNSVILGENSLLPDQNHRRPVREDSKDSATSDVSRVSDLGHASEESVVDLSPGLVPKRHHRQVLRRQNISLDPQERASLEQLIEEVLIGGVDDGVMDPDDSSDEDDNESGDGRRVKRSSRSEDGIKVTPSQLKVAAKHMKNLPPRFLKRLQATSPCDRVSGDEGDADAEDFELEDLQVEILRQRKTKRKTKGLLDSLDQYVEDDVPITDPESEDGASAATEPAASPEMPEVPLEREHYVPPVPSFRASVLQQQGTNVGTAKQHQQQPQMGLGMGLGLAASPTPQVKAAPTHIILRPNVVNYNALDPERIVHTPPHMMPPQQQQQHGLHPLHSSRAHTPEPRARLPDIGQQRFSLDAPEFVPRSFHPINPPASQVVSSPVSHLRDGYGAATAAAAGFYSPRPGSPYTVHAGSPYHLNLSPQMARRALAGSPIGILPVAPPVARHSPIPPSFFIPKAPQPAAAIHGHAAAMLSYTGYPVPHYPVHPSLRYTVPPNYRPPFLPPGAAPHRMAFKYSAKDRLQQGAARPSSAPTVAAPGASVSPSMAPPSGDKQQHPTTPFQKVFGKQQQPQPQLQTESRLDKDGKEAKNLSTQHSRSSRSSTEDDMSPQETVAMILEKGTRLMVILRGMPGSGKTHLAKELVKDGIILSTDDFFVTNDRYEFDYAKIGEAHEWNQKRAKQALQDGRNPVIIDNTNTQAWEMKAYVLLAVKFDYAVEILEPDTPWKFRAKELAKRNKHNVVKELIQRMIDRYEPNVTVASIVATSDKIRTEVERKQRQAAQRSEQQSTTPSLPDGAPPGEERKAKKKTRRGKGRKKKARLRELREAEANKEREKTGDEASSDEESLPDGDQSVDKTSVESGGVPETEQSTVQAKLSPDVSDEMENKTADAPNKPTSPVDQNVREKEEASTPEKKLVPDSPVIDSSANGITQQVMTAKASGKVSDESDSSHDSVSSPSTAESQLSQDSEDVGEPCCTNDLSRRGAEELGEAENMTPDAQLLVHVMTSLEINLHAMLQTKQGADRAALQKLLVKYQTSADVRAEIEDIIKEKMFDGMVNKEVEEITSSAQQHAASQRLTQTDVNSIMDVLGQITNVDPDSSSDSNNDSNNNQPGTTGEKVSEATDSEEADGENEHKKAGEIIEGSGASGVLDLNSLEQAYWQPDHVLPDPYLVGTCGTASIRSRITAQPSWSDSSSSEVARENRPKARRERKRPYKKPKVASTEFWNVSSDKQEDVGDSANSSLASSEPGTPKTPTTGEDSVGLRSHRLSRQNHLPAQFSMPELDLSAGGQLAIKDWQLPAFTTQQLPFSPPVHQPGRPTLDAETYTHPKDFAMIQRLMECHVDASGEAECAKVITEGFVGVRHTTPRVIYTETDATEAGPVPVAQRIMIHRSCSTRDSEEACPEGLVYLKSCFDALAEDDLADILKNCNDDVDWAANILLDAGYEYNEQHKKANSPALSNHTLPPSPTEAKCCVKIISPTIPDCVDTGPSKTHMPSTLMQLCQSCIHPAHSLPGQVQDQLVETSVKRLYKISDFRQQHSSSSSITKEAPKQYLQNLRSVNSLGIALPSMEDNQFSSLVEAATARVPTSASASTQGDGSEGMQADTATGGDELTLTLSPALAQKLITLFGPVGFHISNDSLAPEDLVVQLSRKTAKQLHRRWALTLLENFNSQDTAIWQMIQEDEALAKRMQAEEDEHVLALQRSAQSSQTESQQAIMRKQLADQLSGEYKPSVDAVDTAQLHKETLATKMKRQQLQQMFPTVDKHSLEEVYKASGYNLTNTVSTVKESFELNEPVQMVWSPQAIQAYENMLVKQAIDESLQQQWLGADEEEADPLVALDNPQYQDLRAEASAHYQLRHECFQKAQEAYGRGLKPVAYFYSQQGHLHTEKLKDANRRAALKIVELKNADVRETSTVDLHGLYVGEALTILTKLIARCERELRQRPDKRREHLFVVTGTGSHSRGGKAKIRPAVIGYLTRKHYSFSEDKPGSLRVQLKYRDDL